MAAFADVNALPTKEQIKMLTSYLEKACDAAVNLGDLPDDVAEWWITRQKDPRYKNAQRRNQLTSEIAGLQKKIDQYKKELAQIKDS